MESLENALLEFPGCAVVISHDRWFLDRVATHILAWEGDDDNPAKWYWFEGNFQAYQENKVARLGEDAARPHRLHKKLGARLRYAGISATTRFIRRKPSLRGGFPIIAPMTAPPRIP